MPEKQKSFLDPLLNPVTNFLAKMSPGVPGVMARSFDPAVSVGRRAQLRGPAAKSKEVMPAKKTPVASKPSTPKREKATAVNAGIKSKGIQNPTGDFKVSGAISSSMGGNTNYQAGLENLSKSINTKTAQAPSQSAPKSRKEMRQERRVARLEKRQAIQKEKGKLALSEGRTMDAKQKRYRYNRLQERIDRNKKK